MNIKIAIPDNPIYSRFLTKKDEVCNKYDVSIFELDDSKCFELFLANKVDALLTNPLTFGLHVGKADMSIIPEGSISASGFSEIGSIIFRKDLKTFNTLSTTDKESYLFHTAMILLSEKYDMEPEVIVSEGSGAEMLESSDAAFILEKSSANNNSLDLGEEWYDTFEMPLVLGFWVCKTEEQLENLGEVIKELCDFDGKNEIDIVEEIGSDGETPKRQGKISYEFNKEFEDALAQTFHFLFYHQLIPEIPDIKILGKEEKKEIDM